MYIIYSLQKYYQYFNDIGELALMRGLLHSCETIRGYLKHAGHPQSGISCCYMINGTVVDTVDNNQTWPTLLKNLPVLKACHPWKRPTHKLSASPSQRGQASQARKIHHSGSFLSFLSSLLSFLTSLQHVLDITIITFICRKPESCSSFNLCTPLSQFLRLLVRFQIASNASAPATIAAS